VDPLRGHFLGTAGMLAITAQVQPRGLGDEPGGHPAGGDRATHRPVLGPRLKTLALRRQVVNQVIARDLGVPPLHPVRGALTTPSVLNATAAQAKPNKAARG
jgi:hypothetical protein